MTNNLMHHLNLTTKQLSGQTKMLPVIFAVVICLQLSLTGQSQSFVMPPGLPRPVNTDSLQKVKTDSLLRLLMQDSLHLSNQTIAQVIALRDSGAVKTERIRQDHLLNPGQQNVLIQALRSQVTEDIRGLMGTTVYDNYLRIILGRRPED